MKYIEPARDTKNAVLHVGTNAIFRRKYVDEIGGYPVESITEDMALGLMLQAKGYNSIYINEPLVCGLSVINYPDLVKQRDRWSRGNLQVLKHYKKTIRKDLNLKQKLIYIDGAIYWYSGLIKLIYILTPIIYMLTGWIIVNIPPAFLLPLFILAFSSQILTSKLILPKKISSHYLRFFMRGELYNTIIAPHMAKSVLKHFFSSSKNFSVTSKKMNYKRKFNFKLSFAHVLLLLGSIAAILIGTKNLNKILFPQPYYINLFWIIYNIFPLLLSVKFAFQSSRCIFDECIPVTKNTQAILHLHNNNDYNLTITNISENYILLSAKPEIQKQLHENDIVFISLNSVSYKCKINKISETIIGLSYIEKLSVKQLSQITDIIVKNIEPYEYNL